MLKRSFISTGIASFIAGSRTSGEESDREMTAIKPEILVPV